MLMFCYYITVPAAIAIVLVMVKAVKVAMNIAAIERTIVSAMRSRFDEFRLCICNSVEILSTLLLYHCSCYCTVSISTSKYEPSRFGIYDTPSSTSLMY